MKSKRDLKWPMSFVRQLLGVGSIGAFVAVAHGQVTEIVKTNWIQRAYTNVVEITMPKLVVVDEYRTNTIVRYATNVIEVQRPQWVEKFATNVTTILRTNQIIKAQTNFVTLDRYQTNVIDRVTTNILTAYTTNWMAWTTTNTIVIDVARTNRINAYRTNMATLNATNWETILLVKTNWVTSRVTNTVMVDLPATQKSPAATSPTTSKSPAPKQTVVDAAPATPVVIKDFVIECSTVTGGKGEIVLKLKSANDSSTILNAEEWRVERTDAAVLVMGNRAEFRGQLPPGDYNVATKFRPGDKGATLKLQGTIKVTSGMEVQTFPVRLISLPN